MQEEARRRFFFALDVPDLSEAFETTKRLSKSIGGVKLGLEFFLHNGPAGVRKIATLGLPIFLDLKLHDIPNTSAQAARGIVKLQPFMTTVHISGGPEMLRRTVASVQDEAHKLGVVAPKIIGVTVLTSLDEADLRAIGVHTAPMEQVIRLAKMAEQAGLDGIVCSGEEIRAVRNECSPEFTIVVPGLRPPWVDFDDQKRTKSPSEAAAEGADYFIMGRAILNSGDSVRNANQVVENIAAGLSGRGTLPATHFDPLSVVASRHN